MIKNNKGLIIAAICLIIACVVMVIVVNKSNDNGSDPIEKKYSFEIVDDYSGFFTLEGCVNKYVNYLSSKNYDKLILLLDDDYKKKNSINTSNISEKIKKLDGDGYNFSAKKMYEKKVSDNLSKYYVAGKLIKNEMDSLVIKDDFYVIVNYTHSDNTFSITPYDGTIFKENNNE